MRVYATDEITVIEGLITTTSDELMYTRVVNSFTLSKRGTTDYDITEDYTEFEDRLGNPFADANAFETYLGTLNITDTPTSGGASDVDGGSASSVYTTAQLIDGGNA